MINITMYNRANIPDSYLPKVVITVIISKDETEKEKSRENSMATKGGTRDLRQNLTGECVKIKRRFVICGEIF